MKKVYKKRLIQLLKHSPSYFKQLFANNFPAFDFKNHNTVVLFGAAELGSIYLDLMRANKIHVVYFCDNNQNKWNHRFRDVKIISVEELRMLPQETPIIVTTISEDEVMSQLAGLGFRNVWPHTYFSVIFAKKYPNPHWVSSIDDISGKRQDVIDAFDLFDDDLSRRTYVNMIAYRLFLKKELLETITRPKYEEYFDTEIINLTSKETYVDGGAYTGDTLARFIQITRNRFHSAYCFEPDSASFIQLSKYAKRLSDSRIVLRSEALGKEQGSARFSDEGTLGSRIVKGKGRSVPVASIDKYFKNLPITFIKLDVEGFEKKVLLGSKKTLVKHKPKLAVCVYHKPKHLWELPTLIKKLNKGYRLILRHYSTTLYDTVCYGV